MCDDKELYAVYVSGPDDLFAAPSKEAAEARATEINKTIPSEVAAEAGVIKWPFDELAHARDVKDFDKMYT